MLAFSAVPAPRQVAERGSEHRRRHMDEEGLFDHADAEVDIPNDDGVLEALDPDDPKDA